MNGARHILHLDDRSTLKVTSVEEVISFDDNFISLSLGQSVLNVSGEGMSVTNLSLENGEVCVSGRINSIEYFDDAPRKKRFSVFGSR